MNLSQITQELNGFSNPEHINGDPNKIPSKRLEKYDYNKESSTFGMSCDIIKIRERCPHFDEWVTKLIKLA